MSFGATGTTKTAENNLGGISNLALNKQFPQVTQAGQTNLTQGQGTIGQGLQTMQPGINLFNSLLQGNRANTTAMLQPDINRIQGDNANTLTAINTLMSRGGARSGALFNQSLQPTAQIQNLFNGGRTAAAGALPQIGATQAGIGVQQGGLGANLFNIGGQALNTGTAASGQLGQLGQQQQQITNGLWSGLGKGLFGLATTPFGGGAAMNGLLGLL